MECGIKEKHAPLVGTDFSGNKAAVSTFSSSGVRWCPATAAPASGLRKCIFSSVPYTVLNSALLRGDK